MDPNNSSGTPPVGRSDEKSSAASPPPYQDHPGQPHPQPAAGYPYQAQGYGYQQQFGGPQPYPMGQQYPGQPGVVTAQPTVYVTQGPLANPVNDYLGYSIFTMICCCLPLGIAALIYSISTREANHSGNQLMAERSSRMARILNHVSLGIGIGMIVIAIIYSVVMFSVLQSQLDN